MNSAELQEQKRLRRKESRLAKRNKQKNKVKDTQGSQQTTPVSPPVQKKPTKAIKNKEGQLVFSKFDFAQSGT